MNKRSANQQPNGQPRQKRPMIRQGGTSFVGGLIGAMKMQNKQKRNNKLINYSGIRSTMQFNERTMAKVTRFGEMGGSWTFTGNDTLH